MSYQALYRKYRPQDFKSIVGQPVLVQTLKNAVTTGHISHAYLFSGPRGTGKTTMARVFSKAINCHNHEAGEPCNQCETCQGINQGTLTDYVEIDAASNNGVDEIRNIRSQIKYAPLVADYKIYVIDEAHMLSLGAFNALLKTLEEPPAYAVFILATTNPQKIPATIISRLQKFDFHRIQESDLMAQLSTILQQEHVKFEPAALQLIARLSNGGMRDALSILDQAVTLNPEIISLDLVTNLTGTTKKELLFNYLTAIDQGEVKTAVKDIDQIIREGKDLGQFIHDLVLLIKDILLSQNKIKPMAFTEEDLRPFIDLPEKWLFKALAVLNDQEQRLHQTVYADLLVEIMTIELAHLNLDGQGEKDVYSEASKPSSLPSSFLPASSLKAKTSKEQEVTASGTFQPIKQITDPPLDETSLPQAANPSSSFTAAASLNRVLTQAKRSALDQLLKQWQQIIHQAPSEISSLIVDSRPVAASDEGMILAFKTSEDLDKIKNNVNLQNSLQKLNGQRQVYGILVDAWPKFRQDYLQHLRKFPQKSDSSSKSVPSSPAFSSEQLAGLTANMEAIIKFLGPENVKIIDD